MPVRGNFGVRVVRTDVTSNGLRSDLILVPDDTDPGRFTLEETSDFQTVRIESSSTRILPSVNAIFEVAPATLVRVAGYRAMSRPVGRAPCRDRVCTYVCSSGVGGSLEKKNQVFLSEENK